MFGFLYSEKKKMRQNAKNWLEVARRVYSYRRDQLNEAQTQKLLSATGELKLRLKEKADVGRIKQAVESLEGALRDTGGRIYPASSMRENVEFFLVAAIVILGLRAYFVQPFKIPTNSMWPTYYGMTHEVFQPGEEPGPVKKLARLATLGASNYSITAPVDGEVRIPVLAYVDGSVRPAFTEKPGRSMFVFPTIMREYTLSIGGQKVQLTVPADWARSNFDTVVHDVFFKGEPDVYAALKKAAVRGQPLEQSMMTVQQGAERVEARIYWVPVGKIARSGEKIISFDILTGDLLFVERISYNFFPPKVGPGFVFRTANIKAMQKDTYFIKRLVGVPDDQLEVRQAISVEDGATHQSPNEGQLYRNGRPIDGSIAFGQNARKENSYPGYTAAGGLAFGQVVNVPEHAFFAMGDNSPNSDDSRFWGFVPGKDVVGRPLFIYYPLTKRWGVAR